MSDSVLTFKFENSNPVELIGFAESFSALGRQYISFAETAGIDPEGINARLYIDQLRTGSIIAVLKEIHEQIDFWGKHVEMLAPFAGNIDELIQFFLGLLPDKRAEVSRTDAENMSHILEPVARDGSSQLIIQVTGDNNTIIFDKSYSAQNARAAKDGIRRFLGPSLPFQGYFHQELLVLHQVRDKVKTKTGDRGIIEKFSPRPVKLIFMTEDAKRQILEREDNPFKHAFVVSGQVSTANGQPGLYKIYEVHDVIEKP